MDRRALTIVLASTAGLAVSGVNASVLSLDDATITASPGEAASHHWTDDGASLQIDSIDVFATSLELEDEAVLEVVAQSGSEESGDFGSIAFLPTAGDDAATGDFGDLTAPSSGDGSATSGGIPLASQGAGSKGMPSTSETESGGLLLPPDSGTTEDGRNLSVGPHRESNGTVGTDVTPIAVPGSGIAAIGSIVMVGSRRRRR